MTFYIEDYYSPHELRLARFVGRLTKMGLTDAGVQRGGGEPDARQLPPHSVLWARVHGTRPGKGLIHRDLILRVGNGPQIVAALYLTTPAGLTTTAYKAIAYTAISRVASLHLISGVDALPPWVAQATRQPPTLNLASPSGIHLETDFLDALAAYERTPVGATA